MNDNKKTWADYYSGYNGNFSNIILHYPYLFSILKRRPKKVVEIGCGSADHSRVIKRLMKWVHITLLDNDKKILDDAYSKNKKFINSTALVDILDKKDVQGIDYHDIAYSQGLMEHFEDNDFLNIIENFRGKVGSFIFSVPSDSYPTKDFGNEILRSKKEINIILNEIPNISYSIKNYIDIGINTKLLAMKKMDTISRKISHLFLGSNHLLIEVEYKSK